MNTYVAAKQVEFTIVSIANSIFMDFVVATTGLLFICTAAWGTETNQPLHPMPGTPPAPMFKLKDINDSVHTLEQYKGQVIIINFWSTWCPPCRFELPSMERAYQILKKQDVVFLAIDVGEDADTIFTFTVDYPVTFPLLMDMDSKIINEYGVIGLPTTFVVGPDGLIHYKAIGTRDWDDTEILKKILSLQN